VGVKTSNFRKTKLEVKSIAKLFRRLKVSFDKIVQEIEKAQGALVG
jgi:hypothetical protein